MSGKDNINKRVREEEPAKKTDKKQRDGREIR